MKANRQSINAVIVEDEQNNRELLINLLTNHCEGINVVGAAEGVRSGVDMVLQHQPGVVFLDIELDDGNGFDLLDAFPSLPFKVIFVTGYDKYAIKAIKYAALDYLLKPLDLTELREAVRKLSENRAGIVGSNNIRFFQSAYSQKDENLRHLILPSSKGHRVVLLESIVAVSAEMDYSHFYLDSEPSILSSYPLRHYESFLPESSFFRVHRSHIINFAKVDRYDAGRAGNVHLAGGYSVPIAARRKKQFLLALSKRGIM